MPGSQPRWRDWDGQTEHLAKEVPPRPQYFEEAATFVLIRAITYATLFIGFLLVFLPARVL